MMSDDNEQLQHGVEGENISRLDVEQPVNPSIFSVMYSSNSEFLKRRVIGADEGERKTETEKKKRVLFCACWYHKDLTATITHLSSPTEGLSAKAISVSIQWQLMVHSKRASNLSRVIVKIICFFPLSD